MAVLREIVAKLGIDLDKKGFQEANKRVNETVKKLSGGAAAGAGAAAKFEGTAASIAASGGKAIGSIAATFGAAAVGLAGLKLVELGSDANETLNVLDASFKENSQAVQDWAGNFSTAAGRSEFELREMAGTLGAVLNPLMDRNAEAAAGMSTQLSELAVDLGSFFNKADTDALEALRAGIVGEAEPLKQFGIVMLESTLAAFALSQGITKNVKDMTIAEKTALRYQFILDQTTTAQGDAARTSEGWANASKGLLSALKDLGTRLGLSVLPFAEKAVIAGRNVTRAFLEWQKGTNFLKAAMLVLGAIGAKVALGLIVAWAPVIIPILKFIAIVAVAGLILGDFLTFLEGGDSVIGRFIDSIWGPGSAGEAVRFLKEAWEGMILFWKADVVPGIEALRNIMTNAAGDVTKAWDEFFTSIGDWVISNQKKLFAFSDAVKDALSGVAKLVGINIQPSRAEDIVENDQTRRAATFSSSSERSVDLTAAEQRRFAVLQGRAPSIPVPPAAAAAAASAGAAGATNNSVTVNVQGNATARDAGVIADKTAEAQARVNRRTRAAVTQRAGG